MSYNKRTYGDGDEQITSEDMNRIETGIDDVDKELSLQKDATIQGTLAAQVKAINDDLGNEALETTSQTIHGAINEQQDKINVFLEGGYFDTKVVSDVHEINCNGKYMLGNGTINKPINDPGGWYVCDAVFENGNGAATLTATCYSGVNFRKTFTKVYLHGTWCDWVELATKNREEVDFILSPNLVRESYVNWKNKIIKNGDGSFDIFYCIKKVDGTTFPSGIYQLCSFPTGCIPNAFYTGVGLSYTSDLDFQFGMAYCDSGRIMFHNTKSNANYLMGHVRYYV